MQTYTFRAVGIYKKGRGCTTAIYTVRKSIEYFVGGGSTVNICSIDLSKAFDKVIKSPCFICKINEETHSK